MSFVSELKKVGSLDEAQLLFEKEVIRLGTLDLYRSSEARYMHRVEKVQNDIYKHLDRIGVSGVLCLYQDMLISTFDDAVTNVESNDDVLERDKRFFKWLFFGIFVWSLCLYGLAYYISW